MIIGVEQAKEIWKQNLHDDYMFQVYIHSPFCKTLCKFCAYQGKLLNQVAYDIYYGKYLPGLIESFSSIISSREVDAIYFGGGTPSLMGYADMHSIFSMIPNFQEVSNKYFEIHPAFFDLNKMQLLKEFNFQTVTFGIQTFNEEEIKRMNRYEQNYDHVIELVNKAKELGLKIGIDLLLWEDNKQLYEDLLRASVLEFDVIFAAIDYNMKYINDEYLDYFIETVQRFAAEESYSYHRAKSLAEDIKDSGNIRLFKNGREHYTQPGVFQYDSSFHICDNEGVATLALGSYGKQMVPTTSSIGSKIIYNEVNNNWNPTFNMIKKREPFIWKHMAS